MNLLITGGTGSLGQALVQHFLHKADRIVVYSRDELKQSVMAQKFPQDHIRFFLGDVRDRDRLALAMHHIDVVVHAAALKQVPSCEFFPMEAVRTNVLGTENVLNAALAAHVKKLIVLAMTAYKPR